MATTKERVTLVLGEDRVVAVRDDLASKSEYFAALLSSKFNDGLKEEHQINYDIEVKTLQTFVSWCSDRSADSISTEFDCRHIKPSLAELFKRSAEVEDVLQLLQLSVLLIADTLVKELTDLIACRWLNVENSLRFWSIAKELNLATLRDLAKAACLENIYKLPRASLLELQVEEFLELSTNFYSQFRRKFLDSIVSQWNKQNVANGRPLLEIRYYSSQPENNVSVKDEYSEKIFKSNTHCVVGHKKTEDNKLRACVYSWDGKNIFELVELRCSPTPFAKEIIGRQVVAVGFDIYCVGGEYGLGTGRFELDIWRYSTISKTWYYVTSLLEPRRHMAVVYVKGKLFLIGGVGRHRLKLTSVHEYDICTGDWDRLPEVPVTFTSVPLSHAYNGLLHLYKSHLYFYILDDERWIRDLEEEYTPYIDYFPNPIQYIFMYRDRRYIIDSDDSDRRKISSFQALDEVEIHHLATSVTPFKNQTLFQSYLIGFSCEQDTISVEVMKITDNESILSVLVHKEKRPADVHDFCCEAPVGCFSIPRVSTLINDDALKPAYCVTLTDS